MSRPAVLEQDPEAWRAEALEEIERLARRGLPFTAEDLRRVLPEPHHHSQWGCVFRTAKGRGLIEEVRSRPSTTRSRRGGRLVVWIGTEPTTHSIGA